MLDFTEIESINPSFPCKFDLNFCHLQLIIFDYLAKLLTLALKKKTLPGQAKQEHLPF
jgi:hypothetical protein